MTTPNYRYYIRGHCAGPIDEKPAVIGRRFLQTLDSLSEIDPLFTGWKVFERWEIVEKEEQLLVSLADARNRIVEIVENCVAHNEYGPAPKEGYDVAAYAGARGARKVTFTVRTWNQIFMLEFGEHYLASDLSIVTYPRFRAALLAICRAWDAQWAAAQACRSEFVKTPMDFGPGVPAFKIETATQVPIDPTFPRSALFIPWIAYLSAKRAAGVALAPEILTERTPDDGLLMSATTERLDPTNPAHVRHARIIAETLIPLTDQGMP
jgi:hypothetical protein